MKTLTPDQWWSISIIAISLTFLVELVWWSIAPRSFARAFRRGGQQ